SGKTTASADTLKKLYDQVLQSEIDQKVLLVRAEQDSTITPPTEAEIDERLDERIRQYERQLGSRGELERAFGKTVAEINSSQDLRDKARETIMIEKLRSARFPRQETISRRDVQEFYRQYKDSLPRIGAQVELA